MGACMSSGEMLIPTPDGDVQAFHKRFVEDVVLGEGEFGVVKRVYEAANSDKKPLACKTLKKGVTFKANVMYPALPPEMLQGEIAMLRATRVGPKASSNYILQLHSIYESPSVILLVTEICDGGEMMEYVAKQDHLRTEDVSRIAFQLLTAIDYCAKKQILHRDIKPQNIMFESDSPKSDLRLIDFGAGVMDSKEEQQQQHTTFAGTPFYNSPEMFQNKYTQKTDVFSVGVTLYVLIAGYPADCLQKAFNVLQKNKRNLKEMLPNLPQDMPDSYYDLLEGLLAYQPKQRKAAGDLLAHPFCTFFQDLEQEEAEDDVEAPLPVVTGARKSARSSLYKAQSMVLNATVERHTLMLGYQKFERSLTTLLATMVSQPDLVRLMALVKQSPVDVDVDALTECTTGSASEASVPTDGARLGVVPLSRVMQILEKELENEEVVDKINGLPNASKYTTYAYHTSLLQDFVKPAQAANKNDTSGSGRMAGMAKSMSFRKGGGGASSMRSLSKWTSNSASFRKPNGSHHGSFSASPVAKPGRSRAQSVMISGV